MRLSHSSVCRRQGDKRFRRFSGNWLGSQVEREHLLDAFEDAWRSGVRPAIEAFLPEGPARLPALAELAQTELELRLRAGELARAEDYLERFPDLASDSAAAIGLVLWEARLRRVAGHPTARRRGAFRAQQGEDARGPMDC